VTTARPPTSFAGDAPAVDAATTPLDGSSFSADDDASSCRIGISNSSSCDCDDSGNEKNSGLDRGSEGGSCSNGFLVPIGANR